MAIPASDPGARGRVFSIMKQRRQRREKIRQKRREVRDQRRENDLCLHADDVRGYATEAECDSDERPAAICPTCSRKRLIKAIINPNFAQEVYQGVPTQLVAEDIAGEMR